MATQGKISVINRANITGYNKKTLAPEFVKLPFFADNSATVSISFAPDMIITFNGVNVGVANTASSEFLSLIGVITV